MANQNNVMRLNRFLARCGHGSRRSAEELIRQGKVSIAGKIVVDLSTKVDPESDQVSVDGMPVVLPKDFRIYAFHKPAEVVSTLKSQGGQASLEAYRMQSDIADRMVPVGRLDSESTGLLLWTDDGNLNQALCKPGSGVWKTYEVQLNADLPATKIPQLTDGLMRIDGRPCRPCRLEMESDKTTRHYIMQLQEGRRRQIRRMFKKLGIKVISLHRVAVGPVKLGLLRPGDFRRLSHDEEQSLRKELLDSFGKTEESVKNSGKFGKKSHSRRRKPTGR
ncbi:MAG: rRNA pseudouridine synthase [bacterium]|nr:rRNA pseudouridine synthase [bacterium]